LKGTSLKELHNLDKLLNTLDLFFSLAQKKTKEQQKPHILMRINENIIVCVISSLLLVITKYNKQLLLEKKKN
jgi:hypothetical protein